MVCKTLWLGKYIAMGNVLWGRRFSGRCVLLPKEGAWIEKYHMPIFGEKLYRCLKSEKITLLPVQGK